MILSVLAKKNSLPVQKRNYLQFYDICGYDKKIFYPSSFGAIVGIEEI